MIIEIGHLQISLALVHVLLQHMFRLIAFTILIVYFSEVQGLDCPILVNKEFLEEKAFRFLHLILHLFILVCGVKVCFDLEEYRWARLCVDLLADILGQLGLLPSADKTAW